MLTVISSVELLQAQNQKWVLSFFVFIKFNVGIDLTLKSFQDHPVYSVAVALFCTFSPSALSLKFTAPGGSPLTHLFINLRSETCEFWVVLWCFIIIQTLYIDIAFLIQNIFNSSYSCSYSPLICIISEFLFCVLILFSVHFYRSCLFTIDFLFSFYLRYLLYPLGLDFFFPVYG